MISVETKLCKTKASFVKEKFCKRRDVLLIDCICYKKTQDFYIDRYSHKDNNETKKIKTISKLIRYYRTNKICINILLKFNVVIRRYIEFIDKIIDVSHTVIW